MKSKRSLLFKAAALAVDGMVVLIEKHAQHNQQSHGSGGGGKPVGLAKQNELANSVGFRPQADGKTVGEDYFKAHQKFKKAGWKPKGKTEWSESAGVSMRADSFGKGKYTAKVTASSISGQRPTKVEFFE